ncbi:hypothetical protein LSCM1_04051 [Leishmania martiniquensis]|uniref:Transmembrane protein n=1 Tax=Leishmania martiniquensis TaxID=1580590 RepID=A0A836GPE4_9TRYP|nr:hypothetical protein LSCM1_04051 [Leishmania martiniquensis]
MRALLPFSTNAVAAVRRAPQTHAARARCGSVATVEISRTLAKSPLPMLSSPLSENVSVAEDAAAATTVTCEDNAAVGAATPTPTHRPARPAKGFQSSTRFMLSPSQVNESNVPSAREVRQMLPTLQELRAQLPDARELEQTYIRPESVLGANGAAGLGGKKGEHTAAATASLTVSSLFFKTTDPLEEFLFGHPKGDSAASAEAERTSALQQRRLHRQHLLLAYRALFWGTLFAVLGFVSTVATAMYVCGYHSLHDLQQGVRHKKSREDERLRAMAAAAATAQGSAVDTPVEHYVLNLTHPTEVWRQVRDIWGAVQRLAEEEERRENASPAASLSVSPAVTSGGQ